MTRLVKNNQPLSAHRNLFIYYNILSYFKLIQNKKFPRRNAEQCDTAEKNHSAAHIFKIALGIPVMSRYGCYITRYTACSFFAFLYLGYLYPLAHRIFFACTQPACSGPRFNKNYLKSQIIRLTEHRHSAPGNSYQKDAFIHLPSFQGKEEITVCAALIRSEKF